MSPLFGGLWLVVLGMLGAASLIIARRPQAKDLIDKLTPYQGWIGAVSAVFGVVQLLRVLLHLELLRYAPVFWITWLAEAALLLVLGLLLGVGVIKSFVSSAPANARLDGVITRLAPYQGRLGVVSIGVGIWMMLLAIVR